MGDHTLGFHWRSVATRSPTLTGRWEAVYDAASCTALLRTYSGHIALPEVARERLLAGIARFIEDEYGGRIVKGYLVILHLARKR